MCGTFDFSFIQKGISPQRAMTDFALSVARIDADDWDLVRGGNVIAKGKIGVR